MSMYASRPRPSLWLALCLLALGCLAVAQPALGAGDDYPAEYRAGGTATDRWGFAPRSYGSFISWRLEQRGVRVSAGGGWSDLIQSPRSMGELMTIASFAGARIDQAPEAGSIARWPAGDPAYGPDGYAAWVTAVNGDGTVELEDYDGGIGYFTSSAQQPPFFIHPPTGAAPPGTGPTAVRPAISAVSLKGRYLRVKMSLREARLVSVQVRGKGRTLTVRRRFAAGPRTVAIRLARTPARGRYIVTLRAPASTASSALSARRVVTTRG